MSMTREEAINAITQFIENYAYGNDLIGLKMAIETLKKERPHGECGTCKHFVKGGLNGKTYVCEHPNIEQDDYFNYAFLTMDEKDFCSCYENYEKKEGEENG